MVGEFVPCKQCTTFENCGYLKYMLPNGNVVSEKGEYNDSNRQIDSYSNESSSSEYYQTEELTECERGDSQIVEELTYKTIWIYDEPGDNWKTLCTVVDYRIKRDIHMFNR